MGGVVDAAEVSMGAVVSVSVRTARRAGDAWGRRIVAFFPWCVCLLAVFEDSFTVVPMYACSAGREPGVECLRLYLFARRDRSSFV